MLWTDFGRFHRGLHNQFGWYDTLHEQLRQMQDKLNKQFSVYERQQQTAFPAFNVYGRSEGVVLTAEIPGLQPKDIDVSVVGNTVTVTLERKPLEVTENESFHRQERWYGKYSRSIDVPFNVDSEKVTAKFSNGILYLFLPKIESDKPKKVEIKTA
ncbi:MAG: Hsp20/alpha crystallin family protein [Candidatus Magnetoovum sp. WYHC-5]|nr:Hsp20/alpha crystallin family protein [Candidatus Magnetoovum sp. WYHC-5]